MDQGVVELLRRIKADLALLEAQLCLVDRASKAVKATAKLKSRGKSTKAPAATK